MGFSYLLEVAGIHKHGLLYCLSRSKWVDCEGVSTTILCIISTTLRARLQLVCVEVHLCDLTACLCCGAFMWTYNVNHLSDIRGNLQLKHDFIFLLSHVVDFVLRSERTADLELPGVKGYTHDMTRWVTYALVWAEDDSLGWGASMWLYKLFVLGCNTVVLQLVWVENHSLLGWGASMWLYKLLCWGAILWSYSLYELRITVWVEVHLCDCTNCCVGVQYCDLTACMSWGSQFVGLRCIYVIIQLVCVGVQNCDLTTCLSWGPQFGLWCIYVIVQLVCGKAHRCDSFVEMRESWIELISVSC